MSIPLTQIRMRDPFIIESQPGEFVLFGTTDPNLWGGPGTGFDCYTSTNLQDWMGPFEAFRPPTGFWADTQFWAPEVHAYQGRFFMLATFASSNPNDRPRGTAILVSDSVTGPFVPHSDGPVTPTAYPCLDGTLYVDPLGTPWIVYSRGAEGIAGKTAPLADGQMHALQLTRDLTAAVGQPVLLFQASEAKWAKPMRLPGGAKPPAHLNLADDPLFTDGAYLFNSPNGSLCMLWSSFGDEGYAMGVAISETGSVLGPWNQTEHPVWAKNGGHGMVLGTGAGKTYLTLHWPNNTPDERVQLVEIAITDAVEQKITLLS